ncbi:hypothetical protein T05_5085 [Trichinella murrelli]|uniref:HTH psq-type domain-containing protein n=1 Tax=Trichinella murrelli TaxID=144512 RepID=A0A0V0T995_9BILA|nr:hypothetical protein T05_5085 [Trichinella murrelli]
MSDVSNSGTGKVLSFEQKLEVCQQVDSGESFRKTDGKSVKKRALLSARNVRKCRVIAERSRTLVYR